jgi:hypothetical protein
LEISAAESACLTAWAAFPTANRDSPVIVGENPAKACRMSSVPPVSSSSHPRPWEDKNPWIAGVLAFLIPGAGHLYQGRTVKGIIYCVSILGLFFWGQKMGEGMVVYGDVTLSPPRIGPLSYVAQLGVGGFSLPAAFQNKRAKEASNHSVRRLTAPFTAPFAGTLNPPEGTEPSQLVGTVRLDPAEGQFGPEVKGTFDGTLDGKPVKLELGGPRFELDRPIKAGSGRKLECGLSEGEGSNLRGRAIIGTVPRSLINSYGVTPDPAQIQDLNDSLGKTYELALVFTWIAGLLNFLAIWDCGFGDEHTAAAETKSRAVAGAGPPPPAGTKEEPIRPEIAPVQKTPV